MTAHRWVDTPPIGRWCEGCTLTEAEVTGDECGGYRTAQRVERQEAKERAARRVFPVNAENAPTSP